ncbi:ABC transporter permease [Commensalibacter intestini]|uniref:ABC transporter permease n=1 Tax=Commensalibacter intestini TaxID=479936 RepID=UPI0014796818|nr:ABC transporter permease [Commensalibacter intestini]
MWRLAFSLGWFDIKLRYKGSVLGPVWITATSAAMIATMGLIYSSLFKMDLHQYLPFVALSTVLWQHGMATTLSDGCQCFLQADDTIHSIKLPFFLQALRTIIRNGIILSFNLVIPAIVFIYYNKNPGWIALETIPGLLLWLIDGLAICLFLGCICARYRDIPQIINSFIQIVFYITPIIWLPSQLKHRIVYLVYNPLYPIIDVVRGPLLGESVGLRIWMYALGYSIILWLFSGYVFIRARGRIAFWI